MGKFYPPYKKEVFINSLNKRKELTFKASESIYTLTPPFPREITLDINNRCNINAIFALTRRYESMIL